MAAISHIIFDKYPEFKAEVKDLGLWYRSERYSLSLYQEGQYRHVFWKPGRVRSTLPYRTYYVYTPAVQYSIRYGMQGLSRDAVSIYGIRFVAGPRRGERKRVENVIPNRQCLGRDIDIVYHPERNNLNNIFEGFWSAGMNMDYNLIGKFWQRLCVLEGHSRLAMNDPGYSLFRRWEDLTPEEVEKLCSTKPVVENV